MLTAAERLPFDIKRVFWVYCTTGLDRGGHAHKECEQMIVAVHGRFRVVLDGEEPGVSLITPHFGVYVPAGVHVTLTDWSAGAVALVLCSQEYDKDDYLP